MVLAGALLQACETLLGKGIHPTSISESFQTSLEKSMQYLENLTKPVDLADRESLISCVNTALSSKIIAGNSQQLSPLAVDAVLKVIFPLFKYKLF